MGLHFKKEHEDYVLGVWKMTENLQEMLDLYQPDTEDSTVIDKFINEKRKMEWLGIRLLLQEITGQKTKIVYDEHGKPCLEDQPYQISISHSREMVALIISHEHKVGIDIEEISEKILKIKHKFLNYKELKALRFGRDHVYHAYLHWSAKEALYKIYGQKNLDFNGHMFIEPFFPKEEGSFNGYIETENFRQDYNLNYTKLGNFCLVWICK
jgi:4'-phosphopantetheinyl transferase